MPKTPPPNTVKGLKELTSSNSISNSLKFLIKRAINEGVCTADVVRVVAVYAGGPSAPAGHVDVLPLVCQTDAYNRAVEPVTLFRLPYSRIQGGIAALVIDPAPGDIGLAVYTKRDSSVVSAGQETPVQPGSFRTFSQADGFYIGGFLNHPPQIWLELTQDKVATLHAPEKVIIETKTCVINAEDSATINTKRFTVNASQRVGIHAPDWDFGDLDGSGAATANMRLNINQTGRHVSTGDQIAGGVSQMRHVHRGVQPGGGNTGEPQ